MGVEDTTFQEQAVVQWRDWRRYLSLHLRLLDLRSSGASVNDADPFELSAEVDPEQDIRQQIATIPNSVRVVFEQAVDNRRQQERRRLDAERRERGDRHAQPLDADEVDRVTFIALLEGADGHENNGIGVVPMVDGWYDVDAEMLGAVPDESRYRLRGGKQSLGAGRIAAVVGIVVVAVALIWVSIPHEESASAPVMTILVNNQASVVWTPRSVTFSTTTDHVLPIAERGTTNDAAVSWYEPGSWPLSLCAPQSVVDEGIQRVQVVSVGDAPLRTFTLLEDAPTNPDIVVSSCDGRGAVRYGSLSAAAPPAVVGVGQVAALGDNQTITLASLVTVGPGENPQLPQGKAQLVAAVTASATVDWSKLNAVIRWPDGQDILPSESTVQAGSVVFRYLVPLFVTPIDRVQLRVTDPRSGVEARWEGELAAPRTRAEVIAQALQDVRVDAERVPSGALQVHLSLRNDGANPLLVTENDITVMQDGRRQPLPSLAALRTPLASGETRLVDITISLPANQPLTLSVGPMAYTIGP